MCCFLEQIMFQTRGVDDQAWISKRLSKEASFFFFVLGLTWFTGDFGISYDPHISEDPSDIGNVSDGSSRWKSATLNLPEPGSAGIEERRPTATGIGRRWISVAEMLLGEQLGRSAERKMLDIENPDLCFDMLSRFFAVCFRHWLGIFFLVR